MYENMKAILCYVLTLKVYKEGGGKDKTAAQQLDHLLTKSNAMF